MLGKFVLNKEGVRELLRSPEIAAHLKDRAEKIAAAAGPGHEVRVDDGPNRARASVLTVTPEAMRAEATNRTLTRAIEAGR
jgi:hypothetical protein